MRQRRRRHLPGAQFARGLLQDLHRRVQKQPGHDGGDDRGPAIWSPCPTRRARRSSPRHCRSRRCASIATPSAHWRRRPCIERAAARWQIGGERHEADDAHHLGARHAEHQHVVGGPAEHPEPHQSEADAFGESGPGAHRDGRADHREADAVGERNRRGSRARRPARRASRHRRRRPSRRRTSRR